jgi:hypothetical protein
VNYIFLISHKQNNKNYTLQYHGQKVSYIFIRKTEYMKYFATQKARLSDQKILYFICILFVRKRIQNKHKKF